MASRDQVYETARDGRMDPRVGLGQPGMALGEDRRPSQPTITSLAETLESDLRQLLSEVASVQSRLRHEPRQDNGMVAPKCVEKPTIEGLLIHSLDSVRGLSAMVASIVDTIGS